MNTDILLTHILSVAKTIGRIDAEVTDIHDPSVYAILDAFGGPERYQQLDPTQAVAALTDYITTMDRIPEYTVDVSSIRVTFTAQVGRGASVSIDVATDIEMGSTRQDMDRKALALYDHATRMYQHIQSRRARNVAPQTGAVADISTEGTASKQPSPEERVPVTGVSVEVKDGKRYYKVHGGKYQKYGVRVWPEVLQAAGDTFWLWCQAIRTAGECGGMMTLRLKPDGKPEVVTAIEPMSKNSKAADNG